MTQLDDTIILNSGSEVKEISDTVSNSEKWANNLLTMLDVKTLYEKEPLDNDDIDTLEDLLEDLKLEDILQKKAKTFIRVLREIAQNTFDYSVKSTTTPAKLSIQENYKENVLSIKSSNYFEWGEERKIRLEKMLDEINNYSLEEIEMVYMSKLENWEHSNEWWFSHAWMWFLKIARNIKKMFSGKVFEYNITEDWVKDDQKLYKLELKTNFPMAA